MIKGSMSIICWKKKELEVNEEALQYENLKISSSLECLLI